MKFILVRDCFTSLFNWSRKIAPLFQPIRSKTRINQDLVLLVFPRFTSSSYWLLKILPFLPIGFCDTAEKRSSAFDRRKLEMTFDSGLVKCAQCLRTSFYFFYLELLLKCQKERRILPARKLKKTTTRKHHE